MGNTFFVSLGDFPGHAVENYLFGPRAQPLGKTDVASPNTGGGPVPPVGHQPQDGVQVEGTVSAVGWTRFAGSSAPAQAFASPGGAGLDATRPALAAAASALGSQEDSGGVAPPVPAVPGAVRPHDRAVAAAAGVDASAPAAASRRTGGGAAAADGCPAKQPGVDGGFQRLVADRRRAAGGTADGARLVQPVPAGGLAAARSAVVAGASRVYAAIPAVWPADGDPGGQRGSVCIGGAGGAGAFERLVDGLGDPGGVYPAGPATRQRRTRTDAPGVEGGGGAAGFADAAGAAAALGPLAPGVQ